MKRHSSKFKHSAAKGFTLLEMIIVMGIIAVLAGGVIFVMGNIGEGSKVQTAATDMQGIKTALKQYQILGKTYPSTEQGLEALVTKPTSSPKPERWIQIWTKMKNDPWGNPYHYENNSGQILLRSNGPDGKANTEDDILGDE